ncbi:radical SAM protein [Tissierella creatinini]|nr:radical SAM protein [Tissierella creatinini]TJX60372.1 radical SAM protein [Soehngenia saccharolytica]
MVDIQGLSLIYTNKCNASCRHCGFSCGPMENKTMHVEDAKNYISAARDYNSLKMVCFTGGEPLLFFDEILELMSYAFSLGLNSEIVTNSFWAKDYDTALKKLKRLKEIGLINMVTSLDDFHMEYIEMKYIENAVKAALDLDLNVIIKTLEFDNSKIKTRDVKRLLNTDYGGKKLIIQELTPVIEGRSKTLKYEESADPQIVQAEDMDISGGCGKIIKFPAINPEGELYPCCGFGEDLRLVGKYPEEDFASLLKNMENNFLFNLLSAIGPKGVFEISKRHLGKVIEYNDSNPCKLCNDLFRTEDVRIAVRKAMEDLMIGNA